MAKNNPTKDSSQQLTTPADGDNPNPSNSPDRFIAYPKAYKLLADRIIDVTPGELAAWIWAEPENGGLAAYLNVDESDSPPRFYYDLGRESGHNYLLPLMSCWFLEKDIANFEPIDRYITGEALIERWSKRLAHDVEGFIQLRISKGRLQDLHPICGGITGALPNDNTHPPLEEALFLISEVEVVERKDLSPKEPAKAPEQVTSESTEQTTPERQHANPLMWGQAPPPKPPVLPNLPKTNLDGWAKAIDAMARHFLSEYKRQPNETEAWQQLLTNPPASYAITFKEGKSIEMPGEPLLTRDSFNLRWNRYTKMPP